MDDVSSRDTSTAAKRQEYASVIEVWFTAEGEQDAETVVTRLSTIMRGQPNVISVEAQRPEEQ